jgi:hypothetical protein
MSPKTIFVIAAILLGVGALVGFIPVTSQGVNCGSALVESSAARVADYANAFGGRLTGHAASCKDLRSILRIPAIILLVGGGIGLLSAFIMRTNRLGPAGTPERPSSDDVQERPNA